MKNKKNKPKYVDDGHTIYSMDVDAKWNKTRKNSDKNAVFVSKEEKRKLVKAAFIAYFPKLLLVIAGFTLAFILIYFWLK